jgi:hypothetical protein
MAGFRGLLATIVACCLIVPAAGWAAAPGDRVAFQIPDSARGDAYTVSVDKQKVTDGVDDTDQPGVKGEFRMPYLGRKAHEATLLLQVVRASDGSSYSYESTVDYKPSHSMAAEPASTPAAPRPSSPAPANSAAPASTPSTPGSAPTVVTATPAPQPSEPGGEILRAPERILGRLIQADPLRHRGTRAERSRARRHARRARRRANRFRPGSDPVPPRVRSLSPPRDTRAKLSDGSFPGLGYSVAWKLLAAVALGGLLLPFLAAARVHMRRRREAEMEAELQEIVAEGRAGSRLLR